MNFIRYALDKPVTIVVGLMLILLFGFVSLNSLPYQLTPNVTQPEISVRTLWFGATPYEIEREIIEKQEEKLKSTPGLVKYISTSSDNYGEITLTFQIGVNMNEALLEVSNKLNQVERYPENVDKPVINSSGANASPVIWMGFVTKPDNHTDIDTYKTFIENEVKEHIERVEGVASLFEGGGTEEQMHVKLDTEKLAAVGMTVDRIAALINTANSDTAAGTVDIDRRSYRVRATGQFRTPEELEEMIVFADGERQIRLRDIADVARGYEKKVTTILQQSAGMPAPDVALVMGVRPDPGTNIVDMTNRVEKVVNELNNGILKEHGVEILWLYDQREYIQGAIDLVKSNILLGGILAIVILLAFLRSIRTTAVVGMAIPVSIIATFIILQAMDRSLNTISLAGISFAVGMLLDSAIVVLENIDRHRKMGKRFMDAAYEGATEVWGALIASALTTIAVFVPVIFLEDEAGQLFKDIAIAVTSAISFSLFVSIAAIPMLWTQIMRYTSKEHHLSDEELKARHAKENPLVRFGRHMGNFFMAIVNWSLKTKINQAVTVLSLGLASVVTIILLFPKMEYLPQGNQNFLMNILLPPPGLSYEEKKSIGEGLFKRLSSRFGPQPDDKPGIRRMFFVASGPFVLSGIMTTHQQRARELIPSLIPVVNSFPGVYGISLQAGVFEQGLGEGRSINVDITGESIETLAAIGGQLYGAISGAMPGAQIRPVPSIELLFPEARLVPDRNALAAVGMNSASFGFAADVLLDGRIISEYKEEGKKAVDLVLKTREEPASPEALFYTQIATPTAGLVPIASLATLQNTTGINEIRHVGGKRTITLQVTPPHEITLEEAMETLSTKVVGPMIGGGNTQGAELRLAGQADKLTETIDVMKWNLLFALIIIYLLMSSLFGNFIYPLVIMFTVPMAAAGGFIGLKMTDLLIEKQPLDVLTMLGFIILIGIVVNNAILIVHQSLNNIRLHGMEHKEAIIASTYSRLRPIFMSSLTSIFGMLPLVLVPGPGSEFYRGLGSVITGGLAFSTIFTIFVTPSLLYFVIGLEKLRKEKA